MYTIFQCVNKMWKSKNGGVRSQSVTLKVAIKDFPESVNIAEQIVSIMWCIYHPFTHPFIHSFMQSRTHSFALSLTLPSHPVVLKLKLASMYVSRASTIILFLDTFNMVMLFTISKSNKLNWFIYFILFFVPFHPVLSSFFRNVDYRFFPYAPFGWPFELVVLLHKFYFFFIHFS